MRVLVVDVSGLFYRFAYGGVKQLTSLIEVNGVKRVVDTTLPNYTIKQLHRWANGGINPMIVCFDSRGSTKSRKAYFLQGGKSTTDAAAYKGSRESQDNKFYEGVNMTMNLLNYAGVGVAKADGYEADDLIKAVVDKAKIDYPDVPIDVITGDADLAPLVDDQVSVFLYSRKLTWAENKDIEKTHYVQLRPHNYQSYLEGLTAFKGLKLPYNTVVLAKCLRGDKSDDIKGYPKFTPTKYNNLINSLIEDGYDLANLCRYETPVGVLSYRHNEQPIPEELIASTPREQMMMKYHEPETLTNLCEALSHYLDDEIVEHVRYVYQGINLNGVFRGLPDGCNRQPIKYKNEIKGYSQADLAAVLYDKLKINLPIV